MVTDLSVDFCGLTFKNPITTASGTFGSGMEYKEFFDLSLLGAVTTKGVSIDPWEGNEVPRVAETPSGMLNAIGLQNPGVKVFQERDLPFLEGFDTRIIVNVCGHSIEEYCRAAQALSETAVDILEINISCPNVAEGGLSFGTDPAQVLRITRAVKDVSKKPVFMKLSPNVTSIAEIAKAAEAGGADGLSLINTLTGMKIDVRKRSFFLANRTGGLSGPAIHPVAVRMVYEAARAVSLPIIGMGGVRTAEDALELILAGASMVAVGTANFHDPLAAPRIVKGLAEFMEEEGIASVKSLIGAVE
ncbi:MAG: dihydroorotate dehydrogenase [Lachnospiraceae bacterium]|nr:dihydroorotate dehydrogenase [Lachnospiraceae bacterium]